MKNYFVKTEDFLKLHNISTQNFIFQNNLGEKLYLIAKGPLMYNYVSTWIAQKSEGPLKYIFKKYFFKKGFYRLKLARELKFYA